MRRSARLSLLLIALVVACSCTRSHPRTSVDPLAGLYTAGSGGGAIFYAQALAARFSQLHPGVLIHVENVASDGAISLTASGESDVGFTSRALTSDESATVNAIQIGTVGTAVVVNADNPVSGLTAAQVRQIFSGRLTDWEEVGGPPGTIRVLVREKAASTRLAFESYFFPGQPSYTDDALELRDLTEMTETVRSFKSAIGMATLEDTTLHQPGVRALAIDGVPATLTTLADGSYPVRRPVSLVYNPDPKTLKPAMRAFIAFAQSPAGQQVLAAVNAPVADATHH